MLGYLDDLVIVPVGIWVAVKLIPEAIIADLRVKATEQRKPSSKVGLVAIVLIWLAGIALTSGWFGRMGPSAAANVRFPPIADIGLT